MDSSVGIGVEPSPFCVMWSWVTDFTSCTRIQLFGSYDAFTELTAHARSHEGRFSRKAIRWIMHGQRMIMHGHRMITHERTHTHAWNNNNNNKKAGRKKNLVD